MMTPWKFHFSRMIPLTTLLECDAGRSGSTAVSVTPDHQLRVRARQNIPEGTPVGCLELRQRSAQISAEMVCIGAHPAQAREMFYGRANIESFEPMHIGQANIGYHGRVAGYRALIDERVEVESVAACLRSQVQQ